MADDGSSDTDGNVDWRLLEDQIGRIVEEKLKLTKRIAGDGGPGGGMDAWQHSVEGRLTDIRTELLDIRSEFRGLRSDMWSQFRWLMGIIAAAFAGLLGTMARGFGWL